MNTPLIVANFLTVFAFVMHGLVGDKELKKLEPGPIINQDYKIRETWTLARCAWHWVSFDLLFASIGLGLVNFSNFFENKTTVLQILAVYFWGGSLFFLLTLVFSKPFPKKFLKLGHYIIFFVIGTLVYWGMS